MHVELIIDSLMNCIRNYPKIPIPTPASTTSLVDTSQKNIQRGNSYNLKILRPPSRSFWWRLLAYRNGQRNRYTVLTNFPARFFFMFNICCVFKVFPNVKTEQRPTGKSLAESLQGSHCQYKSCGCKIESSGRRIFGRRR